MYSRDFMYIKDGYYFVFYNNPDDSIGSCTKVRISKVNYSVSIKLVGSIGDYYSYTVSHVGQEFSCEKRAKKEGVWGKYYILSPTQLARLALPNSPVRKMPHERIQISMKNFKNKSRYLPRNIVIRIKDDLSVDVYDLQGNRLNGLEKFVSVKLV